MTSILVSHPQATFFLRLRGGDSMRDAGLFDGDLLVVNRALKPVHGDVVIAVVDGEFTCKTLWLKFGRMKLVAANPTYPEIVPKEGQTIEGMGGGYRFDQTLSRGQMRARHGHVRPGGRVQLLCEL